MLTTFAVGIVCLLVGFGVGRIKNASKLKAISTELSNVETGTITDAKRLAEIIKTHL
jgi:hypothetical protein